MISDSIAPFGRPIISRIFRPLPSVRRRAHAGQDVGSAQEGKWMGGYPVLGYDVDPGGGRLIVNEEEAERVRAIFALFEEQGSVRRTVAELNKVS
jgi:DNA invertase Pin-like site-specific DNA recombinase